MANNFQFNCPKFSIKEKTKFITTKVCRICKLNELLGVLATHPTLTPY